MAAPSKYRLGQYRLESKRRVLREAAVLTLGFGTFRTYAMSRDPKGGWDIAAMADETGLTTFSIREGLWDLPLEPVVGAWPKPEPRSRRRRQRSHRYFTVPIGEIERHLPPDALSTGQAAAELGLSASTIRRMCASGLLPYQTTSGGHFRIATSAVRVARFRPGGA
jgi:excisionase family DNA binding protein